MRYDERVIDEIQSLNDIVEVVSGYIPLKRSGRTFKTTCPFHQEKTPSFYVHPEKQIYHCFGCGVGGNVFGFVMKYENLTFPEALRNLAERVHVALPELVRGTSQGSSEAEAITEVYRLAQEFYSGNLRHPEKGTLARDYLVRRGFGVEILEEFPLGWATAEWRGLFEALSRQGLKNEILLRSGLIQRSREGNSYDLFRSRLIFPIHNLQGKVVAFGGRALGSDSPKYLNSPESSIFRKRKELFGLHLAKRHISNEDSRILVVEGYFDFLRVYLSGFKNVVATLGTALTEEHVRILKRFAQEVVMVYDGDQAGEMASLRGMEVFLEGEMNVKVASLPTGKDPDNFIQAAGSAAFGDILAQAADFFDFKWRLLTRHLRPSDSTGLVRITAEFLETFLKIKNPVLTDRYMKRLASLLGVEEGSIRKRFLELGEKRRAGKSGEDRANSEAPSKGGWFPYPEEATLVALLLEEPLLREQIDALSAQDFRHPGTREVFEMVRQSVDSGTKIATLQVLNRVGDESIKSILAGQCLQELNQAEKEKAFSDCLGKIRQKRTGERLVKLRQAISEAEQVGENERVSRLLTEYRTLLAEKG